MPALEDLARASSRADAPRVPDWTIGCFHRRSICYATGVVDARTRVIWVQSHTMSGDLRIPPHRPAMKSGDRIADLALEELVALASVEGAAGDTDFADGIMSWGWGPSYQPYDKWAEPAELKRVGASLIEFAPSGVYVEDWRFQPSAAGPLAGLKLLAETDADGEMRPREGGLVIAGDHAMICLGRRDPLPSGVRAQDFVRQAADPLAAYEKVAACVTDYVVRDGDALSVAISTDPLREGGAVDLTDFELSSDGATLTQRLVVDGRPVERLWKIETLGWRDSFSGATQADPEKLDWLVREADTLTRPLEAPCAL